MMKYVFDDLGVWKRGVIKRLISEMIGWWNILWLWY